MPLVAMAQVIKQEEITPGHFRLCLFAPEIAETARPGQFVHISCGSTLDPLLRRPLSIHALDRDKGRLLLFYKVVGKGTALLSRHNRGDMISVLGPLGHGFSAPAKHTQVIAVAGGLGIAPLYFFLQELAGAGTGAEVFFGAVTEKQLFYKDEIAHMGHRVLLSTDDGSCGYHGTVTALLTEYLRENTNHGGFHRHGGAEARVYACGPRGMLRQLTDIIVKAGVSGEVSLEERMGCGVGACLSCACKTKAEENEWRYRRVCVEGPVFPTAEVIWE